MTRVSTVLAENLSADSYFKCTYFLTCLSFAEQSIYSVFSQCAKRTTSVTKSEQTLSASIPFCAEEEIGSGTINTYLEIIWASPTHMLAHGRTKPFASEKESCKKDVSMPCLVFIGFAFPRF